MLSVARAGLVLCLWGCAATSAADTNDTERAALQAFLKQSIASATSFEDRFDAEVWLLNMQSRLTPFMQDPEERMQFLTLLHREALAAYNGSLGSRTYRDKVYRAW
ncbi:MAG: hypothetical protein P8N99_09630 [Luminiphilus sp.]|nr:hypothetical protein [Luminiphilus sp.]